MSRKRINVPPYQRTFPDNDGFLNYLHEWLFRLWGRIGNGPFPVQGYAVGSLPDATEWGTVSSDDPFTSLIYIYDETGGATLAFSDGTDWRRVQDRAIVS